MSRQLQHDRIGDLVRDAQLAGEEAISIFRIVVATTLLILIVLVVGSNAWAVTTDDAVNGGAAIFSLFFGIVALRISRAGWYRRWFTYFAATVDVMMVSIALWTSQYAANASLASIASANSFSLYFVAILFTIRRLDLWNTLYTSALSAVLYAAMVIAIGSAGLFGTVLEGIASDAGAAGAGALGPGAGAGAGSAGPVARLEINALNESIKVAALLLSGYLGYGIARANTRLFTSGLNAQQEIERVTSTFGRYVSADLAAQILQTDIESGGEEREATIVFVDIVEFTPATERLTADQVFRGINIFVSHVIQLANNHKGFINKFIGDAVMIVFGAPLVTVDHRERAIDFARDLADRREQIQGELDAAGIDWEFHYGVGVNTGSVFLGNIGNEERAEYTAIGDAVNVAARLEKETHRLSAVEEASRAPAAERTGRARPVLVGELSFCEGRSGVLVEAGTLPLKGKSAPIRVYQVV